MSCQGRILGRGERSPVTDASYTEAFNSDSISESYKSCIKSRIGRGYDIKYLDINIILR